jgi:PAS domain S-box-containing protein
MGGLMAATILLVEDNPITSKLVRFTLEAQQLGVAVAGDGAAAMRAFGEHAVALVLVDLVLPDMDGFALLAKLRALPGGRDVPILAFTGLISPEVEHRMSAAGFDDVITKPIEPSYLVRSVRAHLPVDTPEPPAAARRLRLVVADDDPVQRKLTAFRLSRAGFEVTATADGEDALASARALRPDAIVSDVLMPRLDGFGLCLAVRNDPAVASTPIVLLTNSYLETADRELAHRAGADALVLRTPELAELFTALGSAMARPVAPAAPPVVDPDLERARVQRMMLQLERQVALNAGAKQRMALLVAELSVLTAISEAIADHTEIEAALHQVLVACLDAGAISLGALYLAHGDELRVLSFGLDGTAREGLDGFFGDLPLLRATIRDAKPLAIPSPDAGARGGALLARAGLQSLLAIPLAHRGHALGALVMAARNTALVEPDRVTFARAVASQIAVALALAGAFSEKDASERDARSRAAVLRSILDSMGHGVLVADAAGDITHRNAAADRIFTTVPRDAAGTAVGVFAGDRVTPIAAADIPLMRAIRGEAIDAFEQFVYRGDDGAWYSVNARPLVDGGTTRGGVAVFHDVTAEKAAAARQLVGDRLASLGTLAAGVGHEINNPLQSILTNLELVGRELGELARDVPPARLATLTSELADARVALERMRDITRDLKLFTRADDDVRGSVDVERVLESSIRLAGNEIRHRAKLVRSYTAVPPVYANESRLGQVFVNLLVNAAQAIPEGRADAYEIRIVTSRVGDRVRIVVADTGCGMPPEVVARVFTPFFTTKPVGVGTGLGLAICHQLVTMYGGDIAVDSMVGRGTSVTVTLPAHAGTSAPARKPTAVVPPARGRARVLVVDDEPLVTASINRALGDEHDVTALADPHEALALVGSGRRFDLILCDLMMPTGTGMDLFDGLKRVAPDQAELIVFMTGGAFTARMRAFLDGVANPRLEKPFSMQTLRALINARAPTS